MGRESHRSRDRFPSFVRAARDAASAYTRIGGVPVPPWWPLLTAIVFAGACSSDASSPTGPDPDPPPGGAYDHTLAPGASAHDILSAESYDSLVVQVQYVEGFRPTDQGLQSLRDFLTARVHKPKGISIELEAIQVQAQATYSADDIRALEDQHRDVFTEGSTLALYVLFVDGEYAEAANVLGIAYRNTSMAIFQEKIEANTGGLTQPSQSMVEGVVLSHEVGHVLGLVDNGSPMQTEHRDEPNGHHCDDETCLMYYAVRTTDFLANLTGDGPELDADCLDDLQANGGR